jgi:hypothetical protein
LYDRSWRKADIRETPTSVKCPIAEVSRLKFGWLLDRRLARWQPPFSSIAFASKYLFIRERWQRLGGFRTQLRQLLTDEELAKTLPVIAVLKPPESVN